MSMSTSTPVTNSLAVSLASLPEDELQETLANLSEEDAKALLYDWRFWCRPEQLAPEDQETRWQIWLILTGRGWGKTRTGAEWVRDRVENQGAKRIALVGATAADVRDTMIEGPSGLLACCPPWNRPHYEPSKRRVTWPNGAVAIAYSADEPNRLRGPQHDSAWCDELAAWRFLQEAWDMLMFGLRMGEHPQCVITTTPRPLKLLKEIIADPGTVITRGSLYENADNLAPSFVKKTIAKYKGTRLGRQEISGELLDDVPGALWTRKMIDDCRWHPDPQQAVSKQLPPMLRMVVAIDPAVTSGEESDDTGIIVAGLGYDYHGYVWSDLTCHVSPLEWAQVAVNGYEQHQADSVVGEVNNGGDLVETVVRTVAPLIPFKQVHASRGKRVRAEPIAALYEQGRIHHLGNFSELEDEMCNFVPDALMKSPDRMDALVWAFTELFFGGAEESDWEYEELVEPVRL